MSLRLEHEFSEQQEQPVSWMVLEVHLGGYPLQSLIMLTDVRHNFVCLTENTRSSQSGLETEWQERHFDRILNF